MTDIGCWFNLCCEVLIPVGMNSIDACVMSDFSKIGFMNASEESRSNHISNIMTVKQIDAFYRHF